VAVMLQDLREDARLLLDADFRDRVAVDLTKDERAALGSGVESRNRYSWTTADLPLIDEAAFVINGPPIRYAHVVIAPRPGGGFPAGGSVAAAVVLNAIIYGLGAAQRAVPKGLVEFLVPTGVLIYAAVGVYSLFVGTNYLDYNNLAHGDHVHGQHWGIFLVEIGVLVTVASTMIAIFYSFAGRGRQ